MLYQILTHTPIYVWAILAFLVYRGVLAAREREMGAGRMLVIPLLMLALSLQSISTQFGLESVAMLAWAIGAALSALLCRVSGKGRASPGAVPGTVRIPGSWMPLALMMTIFAIKYVLAVALAIQPGLAGKALFAASACGLLGLCNGCFLGRMAVDLAAARQPHAPAAVTMR
jgi:hypothetical protein